RSPRPTHARGTGGDRLETHQLVALKLLLRARLLATADHPHAAGSRRRCERGQRAVRHAARSGIEEPPRRGGALALECREVVPKIATFPSVSRSEARPSLFLADVVLPDDRAIFGIAGPV